MSFEHLLLAVLTVGGGVLGWLARELWGAVKALRADLDALKVHIAENYVRQDRMERAMEKAIAPVLANLDRIERTLTGKADKP